MTSARLRSGKEKAHKHKQIFPVTARAGGGGLPTGWGGGVSRPVARGQKFMCCVRNPRNINVFVRVPGREAAGRIGDRGDRETIYVPNVYVPFPAPIRRKRFSDHYGPTFSLSTCWADGSLMLRTLRPLQHSKKCPDPPICPDDCFWGFQSVGPKLAKNLSKFETFVWKLSFFNFFTQL